MQIRVGALSALAGLTILVASEARGVDVTTCGQWIPNGETGVLAADLSCARAGTLQPNVGVRIGSGGRLDLAGHRLEIVHDGAPAGGVGCDGPCRVESSSSSPGQIIGTGPIGEGSGIWVGGAKGRGLISNVRIEGFGIGVMGTANLRLTDVTVSNNVTTGAYAAKSIYATDTVATGNHYGLASDRSIIARRTTVRDSYFGIQALRRVNGVELTVGNSGYGGIRVPGVVSLRDSTVTASVVYDIFSARRPRLTNSTCDGVSLGYNGSWGVCSSD